LADLGLWTKKWLTESHQDQRPQIEKGIGLWQFPIKAEVVDLAAYRKKRFIYDIDPGPEFPQPGQPGYLGTYTLQAPYGPQKDDKDVDR